MVVETLSYNCLTYKRCEEVITAIVNIMCILINNVFSGTMGLER